MLWTGHPSPSCFPTYPSNDDCTNTSFALQAPALLSWQKQRAGLVHVVGKLKLLFLEICTTRFTTDHHYSKLLMPVLGLAWGSNHLRPQDHCWSAKPIPSPFLLPPLIWKSHFGSCHCSSQSFQDKHLFIIIHSRLFTLRGRTNNFCIKR